MSDAVQEVKIEFSWELFEKLCTIYLCESFNAARGVGVSFSERLVKLPASATDVTRQMSPKQVERLFEDVYRGKLIEAIIETPIDYSS